MDLDGLDLNLIVSLDALLSERNVTRASERLCVSQPAMSAALQKLRAYLSDPLLERIGRNMELTPRGQALAGPVKELLFRVRTLVEAEASFDPATAEHKFRVVMSGYCAEVLGVPLIHHLTSAAPNVSCQIDDLSADALSRVYEGQVDVCITPSQQTTLDPTYREDISCEQPLFSDRFVLIGDEANPLLNTPLSYDIFCREPYVEVRVGNAVVSMVEQAMRRFPTRPVTKTWVPSYLSALPMVSGTRLLAIVPERLVALHGAAYRLRFVDPPFSLAILDESAIWHPRNEADPSHQWFIAALSEVAARLPRTSVCH